MEDNKVYKNNNKLTFTTEDGDSVEFEVLEETILGGVHYLLVMDDVEGEEGEALILRDLSDEQNPEASYEIVDDEKQLNDLAKIFNELLDDFDLE
ncbi:MAG: DUF1292 domain-containing protein [Lachnospiraceae bacterium]|nr:DUF1292 domain-containing protein [Lachnospiraceae bacterium]